MEFKDHVTDLLTTIDTCALYLDLVNWLRLRLQQFAGIPIAP